MDLYIAHGDMKTLPTLRAICQGKVTGRFPPKGQAPVPLTIFRSNSKFDQIFFFFFPQNFILINSTKICKALIQNVLNWSQWNFAHVTTVTLSWRMQNFVVIVDINVELEHSNFCRISNSIEISLVGQASAILTFDVFMLMPCHFNTLRPRQNGGYFADDFLRCIFLNENAWILLKIPLRFVPRVQLTVFQLWFR